LIVKAHTFTEEEIQSNKLKWCQKFLKLRNKKKSSKRHLLIVYMRKHQVKPPHKLKYE
jgi:hypothetical protein